jgi:hypothetical protein
MRGTIRRINIPVLGVASALIAAAALLPGPAAAAAPANNLLKNVAYYTVNGSTYGVNQAPSSTFCRWAAPQHSVPWSPAGTASQSRSGNQGIALSITGATAYADNGFYVPLGTLGNLAGYTVLATSPFSTNLWFDTNTTNDTPTNGNFFSWSGKSGGCLSSLGGDISILGPASTAVSGGYSVTVTSSSTFGLCPATASLYTLLQFQQGLCSGISSSTLVAVWIGITAASGGTFSTTITSAQAS